MRHVLAKLKFQVHSWSYKQWIAKPLKSPICEKLLIITVVSFLQSFNLLALISSVRENQIIQDNRITLKNINRPKWKLFSYKSSIYINTQTCTRMHTHTCNITFMYIQVKLFYFLFNISWLVLVSLLLYFKTDLIVAPVGLYHPAWPQVPRYLLAS